jgi:glycosyltransferase involved in cell wall biosynthesis
MANTPDPRDCYRVSRVVLMPSLWRESLGHVAAEAMTNGIPVLASDRGALPETVGDAGFVFTIPERCTPSSSAVPTPQESPSGWLRSSGSGTIRHSMPDIAA